MGRKNHCSFIDRNWLSISRILIVFNALVKRRRLYSILLPSELDMKNILSVKSGKIWCSVLMPQTPTTFTAVRAHLVLIFRASPIVHEEKPLSYAEQLEISMSSPKYSLPSVQGLTLARDGQSQRKCPSFFPSIRNFSNPDCREYRVWRQVSWTKSSWALEIHWCFQCSDNIPARIAAW